jgi:hypothetical protein
MVVTAATSWEIICSAGHLSRPGPMSHREAVRIIAQDFENLSNTTGKSAAGERDDLAQAVAKAHALKPDQSASWTIVLEKFPRPVVWQLIKMRSS